MGSVRLNGLGAAVFALMMAFPGIPAFEGNARESPSIVFSVNTFADGNKSAQLTFAGPGDNGSLGLTLPNGATVLDARLNISAAPLTAGGTDCPRNATVDVGNDGVQDWAFQGKGYGDMGHQYQFTNGANSSAPKSGDDGSSTSFIQLPAGARVLDAKCNVTSLGVSSSVTMLGGNSPIRSPWDIDQYRMQWLYQASEINRTGVLDKIGWRVYSGTGSATLSNFKLLLGHTPLTETTDTFDNNWGGETPMTVIDTDNFIISDSNGWIVIDVPNMFVYNNNMSLLIEMSFSARVGTNYLLYFYYMGAGSGTRRLYNNVDYTSSTGVLDSPDSPVHYDISLEFGSKFCMTVDLLGDSVPDYVNGDGNWNTTSLGFTAALGTFMKQAAVNFTDGYGNRFALVPIVVRTELGGGVNISNLSITYEYTAVVRKNPSALGDLVEVLNDIMPTVLDGNYTTIPILVGSARPGRLTLSNVSIDYRPPIHYPTLDFRDPVPEQVVMNENESRRFAIQASDKYGYPLSTTWYIDTIEVARDVYNISYLPNFESAGNHAVSVTVDNTMRTVTARWNVTVQNVNRPPVVETSYPADEATIREEDAINLGITASDPDSQDRELKYNWYVGTIDQGIAGDTFRFKTDLKMAGIYAIRAKATDGGGLSASKLWTVTVLNVNVPPVVDKLTPNLNPTIQEMQTAAFTVSATDFDKQVLTYTWFLDGAEAGTGQQYTLRTGYDSAGVHLVQVVVSDGESNLTRNWTVTVENVNRAPVPVIDRPAVRMEFLDTDPINFSARSSSDPDNDTLRFRWLDGAQEISTAPEFEKRFSPGIHEVALEVTDSNRAVSRTSVKFTVHFIKLAANIDSDPLFPVEGDKMTFTVRVNNTGDAPATAVSVELFVDSVSLGRQTIDSVSGGGAGSTSFGWKARKGEHTLSVKIGARSWNSTVTVSKMPAAAPADTGWVIGLGAVVAIAAVGGGLFLLMSRKKGGRAAARAPDAPGPAEAAAPAPVPPTVPERPAPAAGPAHAPAAKDQKLQERARKLIASTQEEIAELIENPKEGVDEMAAMTTLEKAQAQLNEGNCKEALRLAREARASLAAAPAAAAAAPAKEDGPAKAPADRSAACAGCGERIEAGWSVCPACGKNV